MATSFRFLILTCLFLGARCLSAESSAAADRLFTLKVGPLLAEKCNGCHGDDLDKIKGDFKSLTRKDWLLGGESFDDVLVPGDATKSRVLTMVRWEDADYEMPPKENDRLTPDQIADLEAWITAGAPWPSEARQKEIRLAESRKEVTEDGVIVKTSGGLGDDWTFRRYQPEDIWAFRPVVKPELPGAGGQSPHPVDAFIGERLDDAGFEPARTADARALVRRISFDLTGLPPEPRQVAAFEADYAADAEAAIEKLVETLLDSPHYGERWAQHWLDVARYADTGGMSNDYERSNAWRYRDYVIRSFNDDKPYNRFVMEQLAGDELAAQSESEELDPELLVATTFLRMGPWDPAMVKKPEARQLYLDDVVNSVGQTFFATTLRCVKCHDHKFDPIPTRDYYRIYATFAATQIAERPADFLEEENLAHFDQEKAQVERLLEFAKKEEAKLVGKREAAARKWYLENKLPYKDADARKGDADETKPPRHVGLSIEEQGQLKVREQDVWIWTRRLERFEPMTQSVYNGPLPKGLNARKLRMPATLPASAKAPDSFIYTGGSLEAPGAPVGPGVLSALGIGTDAGESDPYLLTGKLDGRRLGFAKWVAHQDNPLTARAIVNRIWQYHFGKPIAGNPNNFGVKGAKPTHPKLLDWLAADFVENGWKMKRLHRLIMTSKTYRQATSHPRQEALANEDPNNDLFAYHPIRRLTAEELRDAMLKVTGELNPAMGGLPVRPEMNMEVALQPRMIQFSLAPAYTPSPTPEQRNRRSIYVYRVRGQADPFLEVFNQPNPNDSCEMRDAASVSPQAFTLMNSDLMTDRSIAFALRVEKEAKALPAQVRRAFQLALGRSPTRAEQQKMVTYVREMRAYHADTTPEKPSYPAKITRTLVEEFSGQPFDYEEILPVFENYQPDPKAADVTAHTRAMADLCLALFNSHEFVYAY